MIIFVYKQNDMKVNILGTQSKGLKDWDLSQKDRTFTVTVRLENGDVKKFLDIIYIDWSFRGANVILETEDKETICDFSFDVEEVKISYSK